MPVNFFDCKCKTESSRREFGLCDDPPPAQRPAYIDENNQSNWIAIVDNSTLSGIAFYAIDRCVTILRPDGQMENRCDGMLHKEKTIIFVELKNRVSKRWISEGRNQLKITICVFRNNNTNANEFIIGAYIANKQRPLSSSAHKTEIQKFKDETGLILNIRQNIKI